MQCNIKGKLNQESKTQICGVPVTSFTPDLVSHYSEGDSIAPSPSSFLLYYFWNPLLCSAHSFWPSFRWQFSLPKPCRKHCNSFVNMTTKFISTHLPPALKHSGNKNNSDFLFCLCRETYWLTDLCSGSICPAFTPWPVPLWHSANPWLQHSAGCKRKKGIRLLCQSWWAKETVSFPHLSRWNKWMSILALLCTNQEEDNAVSTEGSHLPLCTLLNKRGWSN